METTSYLSDVTTNTFFKNSAILWKKADFLYSFTLYLASISLHILMENVAQFMHLGMFTVFIVSYSALH